jgi:hypothetical protein
VNGSVIFGVWDGADTTYTEVAAHLPAGWPALAGICCEDTRANKPSDISEAQAIELGRTRAWDICPHSFEGGDDFGDPTYWLTHDLEATLAPARAYINSLGAPGAYTICPSGGVYTASFEACLHHFNHVVWSTNDPLLARWPPASAALEIRWVPCGDTHAWATITAAIDELAGHPERLKLLSLHRIVPSNPQGVQLSHQRLLDLIAYVQAANVTVTTVTNLTPTAGGLTLTGVGG